MYEENYPGQLAVNATLVVTSENVYRAFGENHELQGNDQHQHQHELYYYNHHSESKSPPLKIIRANYRHLITSSINSRNKVSLKAKNPKMLLHENHM